MKHILFLTDNFYPEGNAPASRTFEHAREWVKLGRKVTVITGAPNFPEGKVYNGYQNKFYQKEMIEGIEVRRVKTYIAPNEKFFRRTLDYASFMVASFFAGFFVKRPDIIVGTSPQIFTVVSAFLLSTIRSKPFVFEVRDLWPASIKAVGVSQNSILLRLIHLLVTYLYKKADLIIVVSKAFKDEISQYGILPSKIEVITNGVDLDFFKPAEFKQKRRILDVNLSGQFVVGYIGTHGLAHDLLNIVEAADLLRHHKQISFLFVGSGASKTTIDLAIKQKNLKNVISIGRVEKKQIPEMLNLCDYSLVSLKNEQVFKTVIPSKIFESMGMGRPLLCVIPNGEASEIVVSSQCGVIVSPGQPEELAQAILKLSADNELMIKFSKNAIKSSKKYSRPELAKQYLSIFDEISHQQ